MLAAKAVDESAKHARVLEPAARRPTGGEIQDVSRRGEAARGLVQMMRTGAAAQAQRQDLQGLFGAAARLEAPSASLEAGARTPIQDASPKANGPPVVQRRLVVGENVITSEDILHTSPRKRGIDRAIRRQLEGLDLAPLQVRRALAELADADSNQHFATMREAIQQAISMGRHGVKSDQVDHIAAGEDLAHAAMAGQPALARFPKDQVWRLLLDGKHHEGRGKYGFENERGYMGAMTRAFAQMLGTVGQPLTPAMYEQLHQTAVGGVLDRHGGAMDPNYRQDPHTGAGFGLDMENWSPAGHAEMVLKHRGRPNDPVGSMMVQHPDKMIKRSPDGQTVNKGQAFLVRGMRSRDQALALAQDVIDRYQGAIAAANLPGHAPTADDEKLTAIAQICQDLDQMHLFADGNIRTVVFLVLNKLLLEQGFLPVIMDEPNVFDGKSIAELKTFIAQGQRAYRRHLPPRRR